MAAVLKDDGTLVEAPFAVSKEGAIRFLEALETPAQPRDRLIEVLRLAKDGRRKT